jgi:uncharacterized RDD family membrane protein YckC
MTGTGAASWGARIGALLIDWGASMIVAISLFGLGVLREGGWKAWMTLAVYFMQKSLLTWLVGGSFGQLITRVGVVRMNGEPIGAWRALLRTAMVCVVIPAVVIGPDRRGLNDVLLDTIVVGRTRSGV